MTQKGLLLGFEFILGKIIQFFRVFLQNLLNRDKDFFSGLNCVSGLVWDDQGLYLFDLGIDIFENRNGVAYNFEEVDGINVHICHLFVDQGSVELVVVLIDKDLVGVITDIFDIFSNFAQGLQVALSFDDFSIRVVDP